MNLFLATAVGFLLSLIHGPAQGFVYDSGDYWNGAHAILSGGDIYTEGNLAIRGAWSAAIYTPAALASLVLGEGASEILVLVQNSALLAVLGSIVIPSVLKLIVPTGTRHIWLSSVAVPVLLSGFSPYPLLDLWAAAALLVGVLLVLGSRPLPSLMGGLALGLAVNLRPAYLVPVLLGAAVWLAFNLRRAWAPVIGAALAFVPQLIVSKVFAGQWRPWPVDTFLITDIQTQYASFTVRYDTVAFGGATDPRQFYCDPVAAASAAADLPASSLELAFAFLRDLPSSLWFVSQKIAASLHWSWDTPYAQPPGSLSVLSLPVIVVSAIGILALVRAAIRLRTQLGYSGVPILIAIWFGVISTLAFSAPEARFALPIVLIGLVGCLALIPSRGFLRSQSAKHWAWILGGLVLVAFLVWAGMTGLSHPAVAGDVNAVICRQS